MLDTNDLDMDFNLGEMLILAVILPPRDKFRFAMLEASRAVRDPSCKLYTDGHRLAWLPRWIPGWYRIGAVDVRDAYEDCDRTAGCCDIGARS